METAIEADGLIRSYPKGVKALDGLSFRVQQGTVFGLLGPNGAGKSTAVKILTTLAKLDAGRASVAGIDVTADPDRVRRASGVVAQASGVDVQATGRENLRLQGQLYGLRGRALEQRVEQLLTRLGLGDAADRIARGYSGGMQRLWTSRWRSSMTRECCSSTSRRRAWTPRGALTCGGRSRVSPANRARRCC